MPTFTTRDVAPVDFVFIFVRLLVLSPKPERSLRRMYDDQVVKSVAMKLGNETICKGEPRKSCGIDFGSSLLIGQSVHYLTGNVHLP